jgi:hypothetical protein
MGLFGGKQKKVNWKEMQKLMDMNLKANRTGSSGPFGSWEWSADGKNQVFKANAAMEPGIARVMQRASAQPNDYKSPTQFGQMLDAAMAHQMSRQGIGAGAPTPEAQGFGPASGTREGMFSQAFVPPPPPTAAPVQEGQGGPPGLGGKFGNFVQPNAANNWGRMS